MAAGWEVKETLVVATVANAGVLAAAMVLGL